MDIMCNIPDFVLTAFLKKFRQVPFLELSGSLLRLLMLLVFCFFIVALPSFEPFQDVSSSFCSLEISLNSCRVFQQRSTPVLLCLANVTSENLTGFGFVGLDF